MALLLAGVLASACARSSAPTPSPEDIQGVLIELARRGGSVTAPVSGDTGCGEQGLVDNAVHFRLRAPGDPEPREVYLFVFRNRATYERSAAVFEACVSQFQRAGGPRRMTTERLEISPYRAFGTSWTPATRRLLEEGFRAAAQPSAP